MRLWPRTLGMQMIAVTAVAVAASNIAVAIWFELGREQQNESALIDRVLDRAASTATLLAVIPRNSRNAAAQTLSSGVWSFSLHSGKYPAAPMDRTEAGLADRLRTLLPDSTAGYPVFVDIHDAERPTSRNPPDNIEQTIQVTVPVDAQTQVVGKFYRPVASPWPAEVLIAAIVAIIVASSAAAYFARRVTRPLSELAKAASAVAKGGHAPHLNETGPQDIRNAAVAFNAMTDQITRTMESQRQLLSAVGHDLRTPITAMRINLEFIDDRELRDRLRNSLDELQELTEAVLSAARGTGGEIKRNVDLAALVESLCADMDDRGGAVQWTSHDPAPLSCRPNEIRRAVRNLVENALSYGGNANVQISGDDKNYEIVIEDEGPGIPETEQNRVFEPFVRLESSRNEETGGTGLGLTLVKAIAEGHGGAVTLENRSGGGLRARLRLPREAAAA